MTKLKTEGLAAGLRDAILKEVQGMRTGWKETPQAEQEAYIDHATEIAVNLVEDVLELILGDGTTQLSIAVHKVGINKETIEAKISVDRDDEKADMLMHGAYAPAKIVFAPGREKYLRLGERPDSDTDQPSMFSDGKKPNDKAAASGLDGPQLSSTPMEESAELGEVDQETAAAPPKRRGRKPKEQAAAKPGPKRGARQIGPRTAQKPNLRLA